ncbi:MAG: hypothetical protein ACLQD8_00520 [Thermoplasmata archaeon]
MAHSDSRFEFTIRAPLREAAPLFGPNREREWSPGWDPEFLYPSVPEEVPGSVFTVRHGDHTSTWVTVDLDLEAGRIRYVSFLSEGMVTIVDVRLRALEGGTTRATVRYERTALVPAMNDLVVRRGRSDAAMGTEWETALNGLLGRAGKS